MGDPNLRQQLERWLDRQDFEAFLDFLSSHLPGLPGDRTRQNVLSSLRAFLRWTDQEWRSVLNPDPELGRDYLAHLGATVGAVTVKNHLSRLRHLYAALRALEVVPAGTDPFGALSAPPHDFNRSRDAYTPAEVERLLARGDARTRALILLGAHAGLQARQVLALTWADVRWHMDELWILNRPVYQGETLRDALNALGQARLDSPPGERLFDLAGPAALRRLLYFACLDAEVPPLKWQPLRTHAALRLVRGLGQAGLAALDLHSERSYWALHRLAREDVLRGPRRRSAGG